MMRHHMIARRTFFALCLVAVLLPKLVLTQSGTLPESLTDEQFWALSQKLSEPDGTFRYDNLLSNEIRFQFVIPPLLEIVKPGGVYMGVGPEQNFTYIAALKPSMAFVMDIRHGNLDVHLLYKAIFELSSDRADFVSRLFSKKRPAELTKDSTVEEIFEAVLAVEGSREFYEANLREIQDYLMKKRGFPLSDGDRDGIAWALGNYYQFGPWISYNSSLSSMVPSRPPSIVGVDDRFSSAFGNRGNRETYYGLMTATDGQNQNRSYLANEENFLFLKQLHSRNLLVPVVGDFAGGTAMRAIGEYVKGAGGVVSTFYLSNVEQYLVMDGKWDAFCINVAQLPLDKSSMFIRTGRGGPYSFGRSGVGESSIASIVQETASCTAPVR